MRISDILQESSDIQPWMFQTREEIQDWIDTHKIPAWIRSDSLLVEGTSDIVIDRKIARSAKGDRSEPLWFIPVQFNGSMWHFKVQVDLASFKGLPRICSKSLTLGECYNTESLEGLPEEVYALMMSKCYGIKSLSGIHKIVKKCHSIYLPSSIEDSILGLLKIDGLEFAAHDLNPVMFPKLHKSLQIVNMHLRKGKDIIDCKREMVSEGLKDFAKL